MLCELLERRRLLSVSLNTSTHVLTINGTSHDDTITAWLPNSTTLRVTDDGVVHNYPLSQVTKIVANGQAGNDTITVSSAVHINSVLYSGPRGANPSDSDHLTGGSGNDTLYLQSGGSNAGPDASAAGGNGNDTIYVGSQVGFAQVGGGAGNDRIVVQNSPGEMGIDGGTGTDTIDFSAFSSGLRLMNGLSGVYVPNSGTPPVVSPGSGPVFNLSNFENFNGGSGKDYIYGNGAANVIHGNGGDDYIRGNGGNDTLDGGSGHDALYGDDGNDTLLARDNVADFLSGGLGTDSAKKDSADTVLGVEHLLA